MSCFNPVALRKAKIIYTFGLSECSRAKSAVLSKRKENELILYVQGK